MFLFFIAGAPSPLLKHYSGSRIPGTKVATLTGTPCIDQTQKNDQKDSMIALRKSEQKINPPDPKSKSSNRIAQSNYRSNISRLSNKNSDAGSECSSDSGSSRSTPVYGSRSPLDSAKKSASPPIVTNSVIPQMKPSAGVPLKSRTPLSFDKKQSSQTLPIRREHTFDNTKGRKTSSPILVTRRKGSCDDISKSPNILSGSTNTLEKSSSSIPMSRNKLSSESLPASLEENSLQRNQHYESSSSIASSSRRSSIESIASDSSDISKVAKHERYSKLPSSDQKKNFTRVPGIPFASKKTTTESSIKSKVKQPLVVNKPSKTSSRIIQPTVATKQNDNIEKHGGLPCPASVHISEKSEISQHSSAKFGNTPKGSLQMNSSIRPPSGLFTGDKKMKKIESPLTHRNKLNYSNMETEPNHQNAANNINKEQSKLRQPGVSVLSPATVRNTKYGRPHVLSKTPNAMVSKVQSNAMSSKVPSTFRYTPTSVGNAKHVTNHSTEIDFKKEDVATEKEKEDEIIKLNEKEITNDKTNCIDNNVNNNEKKQKQLDDLHIYLDDQESRDIESMHSSRSSELDDGYSSLHKLDNLSPTLGEDLNKNNTEDVVDIIATDLNENILNDHNSSIKVSDIMDNDNDVTIKNNLNEKIISVPLQNSDESCYGYADPEDSIQRHSTNMSDYKVPVDCKTNDHNDSLDRSFDDEFPIMTKQSYFAKHTDDSLQVGVHLCCHYL